jgi:hypothetical protein
MPDGGDVLDDAADVLEPGEILFGDLEPDVLLDQGDQLEPHHRVDVELGEGSIVLDRRGVDVQQDGEAFAKTFGKLGGFQRFALMLF